MTLLANVSVGSDSSFLPFHAKEIFVQLNKGFSEIIIVSESVKFLQSLTKLTYMLNVCEYL